MDKAPVYETGDCRFDPCLAQVFNCILLLIKFIFFTTMLN